MYAIGNLTGRHGINGLPLVTLRFNGKRVEYLLDNEREMQQALDGLGLFQFEEADQFCHWIDANTVKVEQ